MIISDFFTSVRGGGRLGGFILPIIIDRPFLTRLFSSVFTSPGARIRIGLPTRAVAGGTANGDRRFSVGTCGGSYLIGNLSSVSCLLSGGRGVRTFREEH